MMKIIEVPIPMVGNGQVLVKCFYSLISSGTELSTVLTARKSYIGKAKERPQQFKQVLDTLKTAGPVQTYRAVMKKLDAYSPIGYSCSGKVVAVGDEVPGISVGDFVACGGSTASHAEFVTVPANLCVKLDKNADLSQAAYNTLGAIALQGVRQADLRLGETCAVIGLGLIGQLTSLILKASGVRVIGIDINPEMVEIAKANCVDLGLSRNSFGIEEQCINFSDGIGCDAVIIAAASHSNDPINLAGAIARKKGKIVIVGAVPTGFDREPHFYKKELHVLMSCSYGPGRYDPAYEQKGIDYPAAYVRWTENRNMRAFQRLILDSRIDVSYLTTHRFNLLKAPDAYTKLIEKEETTIGVLIEYDQKLPDGFKPTSLNFSHKPRKTEQKPCIGFVGAGSYAMNHLIPSLKNANDVSLIGVMTSSGISSLSVKERYGFEFATTDENDIFNNDAINTVFIASRHDSHAQYVLKALRSGKRVFVEKPLCLTSDELNQISNQLKESINHNTSPILMVGYNRRFSPAIIRLRSCLPHPPIALNYRINAGSVPDDSWVQDPTLGGGRIIGEVCHFIDLSNFLIGGLPESVYAVPMNDPNNNWDTLSILLKYQNGSIATINYYSNGDRSIAKEHIELFSCNFSAVVDDFKRLELRYKGKLTKHKFLVQDKGQHNEISAFLSALTSDAKDLPITIDEIINTSYITFKIVESLKTKDRVLIE